jgi:hypothetical protein
MTAQTAAVALEFEDEHPEVKVNEAFDSAGHALYFARKPDDDSGLQLGFAGGDYSETVDAADTPITCTDNDDTYIVMHRTTGVITGATTTTNWNATTTYGRIGIATFASGVLTDYKDLRDGEGGVFDHAAVAGAVDADDVTYTPTTLADWDGGADPGDAEQALDQLAERVTDLEGGGSFQPLDADLTAIAGLTSAADKGIQFTGSGTAATFDLTTAGKALLDDASASDQRTTLSAAARSQTTEFMAGYIGTVSDKDYRIVVKIPHAGTITATTTRSESGTATFTFKVNTTALGGTANSVSSSEQSQAHASTNTFVADDDIVITASSNSSCLGASFTIQYTRTLS